MSELQLGMPITIDGEDVIIFRDTIGTAALATGRDAEVFTVVEQAGPDGRPPIYIDENELRTLRENFPGTNVYGLWQLLFANNLVPLGDEVVVFPTSETGGIYLQMEQNSDYENPANIKRSAEYTDNYSADLYGIDLGTAKRIRVDIPELKLPLTPAFTRIELFSKKQHERTKRWYLTLCICTVIAVAAVGYNYAMYSIYRMNLAEYKTKKQLSQDLDARASALLKERLPVRPDNSEVMGRIDRVIAFDPKISTPTAAGHTNGFTTGHIFLTRPNFPADLTNKIPGVTVELTPQMGYLLTVSPDPQGCPINISILKRALRPKAKQARTEPIFTGAMYLVILAVAFMGLKVTMSLGEGRKLPNDYKQIDRVNSGLQTDIDSINKLPVLPKLEGSWRIAYATATINGVVFKALDDQTKGEQTNSYSGPLRNWPSQLSGSPRAVLSVAKKIQSEVPTFLYDYTISGGIMKLNITVVGT